MSDFSPISESTVPLDTPPASRDDGVLRCEQCGTGPLYYGGRGRKPRFCDEHKPNKGSSSASAGGSLGQLQSSVEQFYLFIAMGISMVDPYDGMVIGNKAPDLAKAWVDLARTNPKVRKMLQRMTTGSGTGAIVMAHAMTIYPILEHHEMLPSFLGGKRDRSNAE